MASPKEQLNLYPKEETKWDKGVEADHLGVNASVSGSETNVKSEPLLNMNSTIDQSIRFNDSETNVKSEPLLNMNNTIDQSLDEYTIDSSGHLTELKYMHHELLDLKSGIKDESLQHCLTCSDCEKNFTTKEEIVSHVTSGICGGVSCDTCWREFHSKEALLGHLQFSCLIFSVKGNDSAAPSGGFKFRCLECGKWQRTSLQLMKHKEHHHQLKTCDHCNRRFSSKTALRAHMHAHWPPQVVLYKCKTCCKFYRRSGSLTAHTNKVHGPHPYQYQCKICVQTFLSGKEKAVHMRIHRGKEPFSCKICGRICAGYTSLKYHVTTHSEDRPFKCEICSRSFKQVTAVKQHQQIHDSQRYSCDICDKSFTSLYYRKIHSKSHSAESPYECDICGEKYKQKNSWVAHVNSKHHSEKYKCDHCWKIFTYRAGLIQHVRIHLDNNKPHQCRICGKSFRLLSIRKVHMIIHSNEKPFPCKFCDRRYNSKQSADDHTRSSHTKEQPYSCNFCDLKFSKPYAQKRHLKGHAGNYQFKCKVCADLLETRSKLSFHMTRNHSKTHVKSVDQRSSR